MKITNFTEVRMDMNSVAYKDKVREKERQEKLAVYKETGEWPGLKRKKESVSWSKNKEVLDKRRDMRCMKKKYFNSWFGREWLAGG